MIKLKVKEGNVFVNRLTGSIGHEIVMPDTGDPYVWVECNNEDYQKWKNEDNQKLINEEILNAAAQVPQILDEEGNPIEVQIDTLDVQFSDNVYTFAQLMKDNGAQIWENVDLINKQYLANNINRANNE